jgi:hypothetical protein
VAAAGAVSGAAVASVVEDNADNDAYSAGYNAGMVATAPETLPMGSTFATLPSGCGLIAGPAGTFYQCGNSWVRPAYGANGVYYTVVPTP